MYKGQVSFFMKSLILIASIIALAIVVFAVQTFIGGTVETKVAADLDMGALNVLQKNINDEGCLSYIFENTVQKDVVDLAKLTNFVATYNNREPDCAKAYDFDYAVQVRQLDTDYTLYPHFIGGDVGVMLVMDRSGSMGGPKLTAAKNASITFINQLGVSDSVGLVSYSTNADTPVALTTNHQIVIDAINVLVAYGWTNTGQALVSALSENPNSIILLSDGCWNENGDPIIQAQEAAVRNIVIFTIGFGSGILSPCSGGFTGQDFLMDIANITGGEYYYAAAPENLTSIYLNISSILPVSNLTMQNISVGNTSWAYGTFEFSPKDAVRNKVRITLPVVIRVGVDEYRNGMITITAVDGELERIAGLIEKVCTQAEAGNLVKDSMQMQITYPITYDDVTKQLCMTESSNTYCKTLDCSITTSFSGIPRKGEYFILAEFDGSTIGVVA